MKTKRRASLVAGLSALLFVPFVAGCLLPYSVPGKTAVIAHRGASGYQPENTLAAFNRAWELGADGIEGDFYLTTDKRVVCCHDSATGRTERTHQNLRITESSYDQLKQLDFGDGKGIPTLEAVLETLAKTENPEKRINIEIKDDNPAILDAVKTILQTFIDAGRLTWSQIRVIAFNPDICVRSKSVMPDVDCCPLKIMVSEADENEMLRFLDKHRLDGCSFNAAYPRAEIFSYKLRLSHYQAHVWTVNRPSEAKKLLRWGVDSITTNYPDKMLEIVRQK